MKKWILSKLKSIKTTFSDALNEIGAEVVNIKGKYKEAVDELNRDIKECNCKREEEK